MPGSLGSIQNKGNTIGAADLSHRRRVLHAAAYIGPVGNQYQPGIGLNQPPEVLRVHPALSVAGDAVKGHPVLCQRLQRAHYGVVFHGADQTVIPWPQPPAKHHVQPHCIAGGQHAVGRIAVAEQPAQFFPQQQRGHAGLLGGGIHPPVDGGSIFLHIPQHGLRHSGRLGERGGGVIQIDGRHGYLSCQFFCRIV